MLCDILCKFGIAPIAILVLSASVYFCSCRRYAGIRNFSSPRMEGGSRWNFQKKHLSLVYNRFTTHARAYRPTTEQKKFVSSSISNRSNAKQAMKLRWMKSFSRLNYYGPYFLVVRKIFCSSVIFQVPNYLSSLTGRMEILEFGSILELAANVLVGKDNLHTQDRTIPRCTIHCFRGN